MSDPLTDEERAKSAQSLIDDRLTRRADYWPIAVDERAYRLRAERARDSLAYDLAIQEHLAHGYLDDMADLQCERDRLVADLATQARGYTDEVSRLMCERDRLRAALEAAFYDFSCAANACNDAEVCAMMDHARKAIRVALTRSADTQGDEP